MMQTRIDAVTGASSRPLEVAGTRVAALIAAALGALVIWVVGFSHVEAVHSAAHDTRHSNAFPCH
jgi:cobalt transporter subunit CbtB